MSSAPQRRRRRAVAVLAIFATAQANNVIVQPPDQSVHYPSDPLPSVATAQQMPVEYYPPPQSETYQVKLQPLSRAASNRKPHIIKKAKKKRTQHVSHSPWHTAEYLPSRLGSSETHQAQNGATKTQVILRPRPTSSNTKSLSTKSDTGKTIYYYDPSSLMTSLQSPTLTLPEIIYDANGNTKKLEEVHDGGKNEVFLEVKPKAVWGEDARGKWEQIRTAATSHANNSSVNGESDQLIVFGTIATMAILVGMLSAKRLRNKRLLEHCMESDLEEDWVDEKKRDAPVFTPMNRERVSLLYGKGEGGLHWRGDLEKFDV